MRVKACGSISLLLFNLVFVRTALAVSEDILPMPDFIDIKPSVELDTPFPMFWVALLTVLFVLIVAVIWLRWKKRRATDVEVSFEEAIRIRLGRLEGKMDGECGEFYFELSSILRQCLEKYYDIPATRMTPADLSHALYERISDEKFISDLCLLLKKVDLIKYGGVMAYRHEMDLDLASARGFIFAMDRGTGARHVQV